MNGVPDPDYVDNAVPYTTVGYGKKYRHPGCAFAVTQPTLSMLHSMKDKGLPFINIYTAISLYEFTRVKRNKPGKQYHTWLPGPRRCNLSVIHAGHPHFG